MDSQTLDNPLCPTRLAQVTDALPCVADAQSLQQQASAFVAELSRNGHEDAWRRDAINAIESLGLNTQRKAARQSQLLQTPVRRIAHRADDNSDVATALVDLKLQVEALDPVRFNLKAGRWTRIMGKLPFVGTPLKRYFSRYEAAATQINAIVQSLEAGREQLQRDNITLQADQGEMRQLTQKLTRAIELGRVIDAHLERLLDEKRDTDPAFATFVQDELLFPLRQRIQDLQQQLAVNQQGILTIEVIIRNNRELIRGVNRATHVTVSALEIAVSLAVSLANQKVVLDKVNAINKTTSDLIAGTAAQLKQQGAAIHTQAASAQLDMGSLQSAFSDIQAALQDISGFRQQALPAMAEAIEQLDTLTTDAETQIRQIEAAKSTRGLLQLDIDD